MENPQKNVVVVTGATGTGKSKLGVDLALALRPFVDCEIVSCDAMQVYKGLAIATNQITLEEQCGVPHHMIGCQDPLKAIDVVEFCKRAEQCIDQIYQRGHLPIIVGGTLYYLEVLLGLLVPQARSSPSVFVKGSNDNKMGDIVRDETTERDNYGNCSIASVDALTKLKDDEVSQILHAKSRKELVEWANKQKNTQLFALLERLDPVRARKLHPHDTRRIVNSLLTFVESGRAHSTQIRESVVQARLRYRVCVIALQCDRDTLEARLKHRIETMLQRGLINEIVTLRNRFLECQRELDFTDGILQSIGFKEFDAYLQLCHEETTERNEATTKRREVVLEETLTALHRRTLHYARRQNRWLRNHLAPRLQDFHIPIYLLDSSQLSQWSELVVLPAQRIVSQFLSGGVIEWPHVLEPNQRESLDQWQKYVCTRCGGRLLNGAREWTEHLHSRQHRRSKNHIQNVSAATSPTPLSPPATTQLSAIPPSDSHPSTPIVPPNSESP